MRFSDVPIGEWVTVAQVGGGRSIRRRLLEMGMLPGRKVRRVGAAPLGDPITVETEFCRLSIRRAEADAIETTG